MNKRRLVVCLALLAAPMSAIGQAYKCTQPDGTIKYQSSRCAGQPGQRIFVQDNGSGGLGAPPADSPRPTTPAAASGGAESSGLRAGEREMLETARQRDEAAAQRQHEKALQHERAEVAKEAIRTEREHQARLRAQFCARYPSATSCR